LRYKSRRQDDVLVRGRLKELAQERPRFGYRRLGVLLRREGHLVNLKRVLRLYREEGLKLRAKKRKRVASAQRVQPKQRAASTSGG
jgi:putative transposase